LGIVPLTGLAILNQLIQLLLCLRGFFPSATERGLLEVFDQLLLCVPVLIITSSSQSVNQFQLRLANDSATVDGLIQLSHCSQMELHFFAIGHDQGIVHVRSLLYFYYKAH
jgi:hypothetical protein